MIHIRSFLGSDQGATAIEYALIAGLVSIVIVVAVNQLGTALSNMYNSFAGIF